MATGKTIELEKIKLKERDPFHVKGTYKAGKNTFKKAMRDMKKIFRLFVKTLKKQNKRKLNSFEMQNAKAMFKQKIDD